MNDALIAHRVVLLHLIIFPIHQIDVVSLLQFQSSDQTGVYTLGPSRVAVIFSACKMSDITI